MVALAKLADAIEDRRKGMMTNIQQDVPCTANFAMVNNCTDKPDADGYSRLPSRDRERRLRRPRCSWSRTAMRVAWILVEGGRGSRK